MSDEEFVKYVQHTKVTHTLGHVGRMDEIEDSSFLSQQEASFITGVILIVDTCASIMVIREKY